MSDIETLVKMILNTYGNGRPIKAIDIYKRVLDRYPDFIDNDQSYPKVRTIIQSIEEENHNIVNPVKCIGSSSEGFFICKDRDQAQTSAKYLLSKFVSIAIRYQLRKKVMNELFPRDEFSTPLFNEYDPLPDMDLEKLREIERIAKQKGELK